MSVYREGDNPRRPLEGIGVLVTRPAHQAERLCALIEAWGGRALRFPVLEILDLLDQGPLLALIDRLDEFDIAIFISANAVNKAMNLIRARRDLPVRPRIAAIGKGSARALEHFGRPADIYPQRKFDSEALLGTEEMRQVAGKRIVIFRGEGGRELLADTLRERGACVEYAEVYRRGRPHADVSELLHRWARGEIDVVTVTSNESLRNLFDMVGKLGRQWLRKTALVVVSERGAALARELGFEQPPIVAREAGDEVLVEAIRAWRLGRSPEGSTNER